MRDADVCERENVVAVVFSELLFRPGIFSPSSARGVIFHMGGCKKHLSLSQGRERGEMDGSHAEEEEEEHLQSQNTVCNN